MDFKVLLCLLTWFATCHTFLLDENCVHCNWNGVCDTRHNRCQCYDGFHGNDCGTDCGCEGHGHCKTDMTCQCDKGWKWSAADRKCIWECQCSNGVACIGPGVCGCTQPCQYGTCFNGQCECWEGYKGDTCNTLDRNIMMNTGVRLGLNLGGLSYWSPETKFVDVAKQSQEWITERLAGHGAHQWDTHEHDNVTWRTDGYPASLPKTMIVGKLVLRAQAGIHGPQGNFTILYDGDGELAFSLVKMTVHYNGKENLIPRYLKMTVHYNGKGRMVVEFHEKSGGIFIKIMRTNPANPIHNIRVIMPGFEDRYQLFPFYPAFIEDIRRYGELRFMDFFHTNGHTPEPTTWTSRRVPSFHTQTGEGGAAIEHAIDLANIVGPDAWFNQPHAADDDFIRHFANMAKGKLRPDVKIYIEYSNEVWNNIFRQAKYSHDESVRLGLDTTWKASMKYYNKRSTEVVDIWKNVFGADKDRIIGVWAWQTGYEDYTRQALEDLGSRISSFDAIGITGYFDCDHVANRKNISTMSHSEIAQLCKDEVAKVQASYRHYMDVAKAHGVKLLMYEGGPGMVTYNAIDHNATEHAIQFDRSDEMEIAVTDDLESWYNITNTDTTNSHPGGLFNYFSSVATPSKYGSWGMLEYTGQGHSTAPKYRAVHKFINRHFQNHCYGPKCSFILHNNVFYGCFTLKTGSLKCGHSSNHGNTWTYYPTVNSNSTALVLEGYDTTTSTIYVRSVDNLAADYYYSLDTTAHNPTWKSLSYLDYHATLAPASTTRQQPQGVLHNVNTNTMDC